MGVSDWDLLGLSPLGHAWKRVNRPSRFGFRTFSDGFYVSKFTGGQPDYFLVVRQQKPRIGRG